MVSTHPAGAIEVLRDDDPLPGPVAAEVIQLLNDRVAVVDLQRCECRRALWIQGELCKREWLVARLDAGDVGLDSELLTILGVGRGPDKPGELRLQSRVGLVRASLGDVGPRLGGRVSGAGRVVPNDACALISCLSCVVLATAVGSVSTDPEVAILGHWVGTTVICIWPGLNDDSVALPDADEDRRCEVRLNRHEVRIDDLENVVVNAEDKGGPERSVDQPQHIPLGSAIAGDLSLFKLQDELLRDR